MPLSFRSNANPSMESLGESVKESALTQGNGSWDHIAEAQGILT